MLDYVVPAVKDEQYKMPEKFESHILSLELPFFTKQKKVVLQNAGHINPEDIQEYIARGGYLALEKVLKTMTPAQVVEEIKSYFKEKVYDTIIPRLVRLSEAPSHGKPIHAYDPKSRGTEAYLNLAKEVILRDGE